MKIAGRDIGSSQPPFIVAELSANHTGDIRKALSLIGKAKEAGADAVKFQCYTAEGITLDCNKEDFKIKSGPWKGRYLYELYKKAETPTDWFPHLFEHAGKIGITAFASVFDNAAVDLLEELDCPAYKIASFEITDIPLIKYAAKTGKPLIISTGMAHEDEVLRAYSAAACNCAILHCVSGYPTLVDESNLGRISDIREMLDMRGSEDCLVGISDHTLGWEVPVAATALGACIIEKHLMLENEYASEDKDFSLTPSQFKEMAEKVRSIWGAMQPRKAESEESSRQLRRSLYVTRNMQAGDVFTTSNLRSIRPGYGMSPTRLDQVIGKCVATRSLERGTALQNDMCRTVHWGGLPSWVVTGG